MKTLHWLVLLIGLFGLLIIPGCKTTEEFLYDISGTWQFTSYTEAGSITSIWTLTGSKNLGTFLTESGSTGTYSVNDSSVTFSGGRIESHPGAVIQISFTAPGTIVDNNNMYGITNAHAIISYDDGTIIEDDQNYNWIASRIL